jgi:predicted dehydrogenase
MTRTPAHPKRRASAATSAAVAAAVAAAAGREAPRAAAADTSAAGFEGPVPVGLIGCGAQGMWLLTNIVRVPGLAVKAVCDISPFRRARAFDYLKGWSGSEPKSAADYREIVDDKSIGAVLIATPDGLHAEIGCAALKAGKHVYCEPMMATTIEGARSMVLAARLAKKVLHVGYQRRSDPLYKLAYEFLHLKETPEQKGKCPHWAHVNRLTHVRVQFNRNGSGRIPAQPDEAFDCRPWGYDSMAHLRDWRLYRKHGGGWMAEYGSHQIDLLNWMLDGYPTLVMGSAGLDHYVHEAGADGLPLPPREWYDSILTMLEYPDRAVQRTARIRVQQQITTTNAFDEMHEQFMGDEGTLILTNDGAFVYREEGKISSAKVEAEKKKARGAGQVMAAVGRTLRGGGVLETLQKREQGRRLEAAIDLKESLPNKPQHRYALEDFADCVQSGRVPPCSPEAAFASTVICIRASEAAEKGVRVDFSPDDFKV